MNSMKIHLKACRKGRKWLFNNLDGEWSCIGAKHPLKRGYLVFKLESHPDLSGVSLSETLQKNFKIHATVNDKCGQRIYFRQRKTKYPISLYMDDSFLSVTLYSESNFNKVLSQVAENPKSKIMRRGK